MDISRIRKKIKKSKASEKEKAEETARKEKSEHSESEVKEIPGAADKKPERLDAVTEAGQEDTEKSVDNDRIESKGVKAEVVPVDETEILAFKVASEEYAVRIDDLQEVMNNQNITPVPRSPRYLKGVTSVRGKILPIVDLKVKLGLTDENAGKEKIVVLSGKKEPLGIMVGLISGVFRFPAGELLPPPSTLTEEEKNFIEGVVRMNGKFISILKVDEIFRMEAV